MDAAVANGVNLRKIENTRVGISLDEQTRPETIEAVWRAFGGDMKDDSEANREYRLPEASLRESNYLTHPIFHLNRSEAENYTLYASLSRPRSSIGSCDDTTWFMYDEAKCNN